LLPERPLFPHEGGPLLVPALLQLVERPQQHGKKGNQRQHHENPPLLPGWMPRLPRLFQSLDAVGKLLLVGRISVQGITIRRGRPAPPAADGRSTSCYDGRERPTRSTDDSPPNPLPHRPRRSPWGAEVSPSEYNASAGNQFGGERTCRWQPASRPCTSRSKAS